VDYWKLSFNTRVFACDFNETVTRRITAVKCIIGCPKIILTLGWSRTWPLRSPDLNPLETFLWGDFKTEICVITVGTKEELRFRIQQFSSGIKSTSKIFELLPVSFSRRGEYYDEHGGRFEHILYENKTKEVINSSFVFFLYTTD
jgi:hypothetical protein